jgi:hypothetical protein
LVACPEVDGFGFDGAVLMTLSRIVAARLEAVRVREGLIPERDVFGLLSQETVVFQTMSRALDSDKSGLTFSEHHTSRPLLTPDEVRNLPQDRELLFLAGLRPTVADKLRYYADREFKGRFDPAYAAQAIG